jgi:hypothetical protein
MAEGTETEVVATPAETLSIRSQLAKSCSNWRSPSEFVTGAPAELPAGMSTAGTIAAEAALSAAAGAAAIMVTAPSPRASVRRALLKSFVICDPSILRRSDPPDPTDPQIPQVIDLFSSPPEPPDVLCIMGWRREVYEASRP